MRNLFIFGFIIILGLIAYFLYQYIKTSNSLKKTPPEDVKVVEKEKEVVYKTADLNIDQVLKSGINAPIEVKVLQGILGVTADGIFGQQTQAALNSKLNVTAITLRQAFDRLGLSTSNQQGKDSNGNILVVNKYVATRGAQKINYLIAKVPNPSKYSDFTVGEEVSVGDGFPMGYILVSTGTEVLTKAPALLGKGDVYYYALNNKVKQL